MRSNYTKDRVEATYQGMTKPSCGRLARSNAWVLLMLCRPRGNLVRPLGADYGAHLEAPVVSWRTCIPDCDFLVLFAPPASLGARTP
jgi:hypothetical protein